MTILLIGEYSRLHNSLKEGLAQCGVQVTIAGFNDGFKNYPVDIRFKKYFDTGLGYYLKRAIHRLTTLDITTLSIQYQFYKNRRKLRNYDVVQLINENPFYTHPKSEQKLLRYIFSHNKRVFLLACGTDYISVKYAFDKQFKYSIQTPYEAKKISKTQYQHVLKWRTKPYETLHRYIFEHIHGVIASDMDYHLPMQSHKHYLGLIPNPINTDTIPYIPMPATDRIIIFHGINTAHYFKKGNDFFEAALQIIRKKYHNKVSILTLKDRPYTEYTHAYDHAHIVLDQVYAYDQGYNALEAMAKGKVVFTGAESEWLTQYDLPENTVAINALPDAETIAHNLGELIDNPLKIQVISENARQFIEQEHHYVKIAKRYMSTWISAKN